MLWIIDILESLIHPKNKDNHSRCVIGPFPVPSIINHNWCLKKSNSTDEGCTVSVILMEAIIAVMHGEISMLIGYYHTIQCTGPKRLLSCVWWKCSLVLKRGKGTIHNAQQLINWNNMNYTCRHNGATWYFDFKSISIKLDTFYCNMSVPFSNIMQLFTKTRAVMHILRCKIIANCRWPHWVIKYYSGYSQSTGSVNHLTTRWHSETVVKHPKLSRCYSKRKVSFSLSAHSAI